MVGDTKGRSWLQQTGRVVTLLMAKRRDAPGFVVGYPVLDPIAYIATDNVSQLSKGGGRLSFWPATGIL